MTRLLQARERVAFFGMTGSGKGRESKRFVGELANSRVVFFDPHDEWSREGRETAEVKLGPLKQRAGIEQVVEDPERWLGADGVSLAVVPRSARAGQLAETRAEDFATLCDLVRHVGDVVLGADELGRYGERCADLLDEVACEWRHIGVPCIFISQRAVHVPKDARTQISELWSGWQTEPSDLDALADRCGKDFARRVAALGQEGGLAHWTVAELEAQLKKGRAT